MKKILKLALPILIIAAAFAVWFAGTKVTSSYRDTYGHWAWADIKVWSDRGVMSGTGGKFRPDDTMTLAEFSTLLCRIIGTPEPAENIYDDVPAGSWYEDAVLRCTAAGIIAPEGSLLYPWREQTREDICVLLCRAFDIAPSEDLGCLSDFNDGCCVSKDAGPYVSALISAGLISGRNEVQLCPQEKITRAEMAVMLTKLSDAGYIE